MYNTQQNSDDNSSLTYDLRQRRAKLIADCIDDVVESAKAENYNSWLKNIDDLHSVSKHTFKDNFIEDGKKKKYDYGSLRNNVVVLANLHSQTWLGKEKDADAIDKIENSLRALFEYVLERLEDSGVFGTKYEDDGL